MRDMDALSQAMATTLAALLAPVVKRLDAVEARPIATVVQHEPDTDVVDRLAEVEAAIVKAGEIRRAAVDALTTTVDRLEISQAADCGAIHTVERNVDQLLARVAEVEARPLPTVDPDLPVRVAALETRDLAVEAEALFLSPQGREMREAVVGCMARVMSLEARPVPDASIPARVDHLETRATDAVGAVVACVDRVKALEDDAASVAARVAAVEASVVVPEPVDDLAALFVGCLAKELDAIEAAAPRVIQKRIVRDARGVIERVVEESVSA